jgi:hypothetical protein
MSAFRDTPPQPRRDRRAAPSVRALASGLTAAAAVAVVFALVGPAVAAGAEVKINRPANGSMIRDRTPTFSGTTDAAPDEDSRPTRIGITLSKEGGATSFAGAPFVGRFWSATPESPLEPGTYTAEARQEEELFNGVWITDAGVGSSTVTFTIDTTPPQVSLTSPSGGTTTTGSAQVVSGSAGTAPGDVQEVTVQLFSGASIGAGEPAVAVTVPVSAGSWSATLGGLGPGTYTARALQSDVAGNVGQSSPVTFTLTASPAHTPPVASFTWYPPKPKVGETVTLISSSVDESSPITAFAWSLASTGPFASGKAVQSTSFSTPGDHVVRLQVTAADGLSSSVAQTIQVARRSLPLMQPFPIVRIAGLVTSRGVKLRLFTVKAPLGARIRVSCRGRGCPRASESRVAASSSKKRRPSSVVVRFGRFQRSLRAGVVLEVRVYKRGQIGKYTRFVIHRGKLPSRIDKCVGEAGAKPIDCPVS